MGYRRQTPDRWAQLCYEYAPLGPVAVEDAVREVALAEGIEVVKVEVTVPDDAPHCYSVVVTHRDVGVPSDTTVQHNSFCVLDCRHGVELSWALALRLISARRERLPVGQRGEETNVTLEEYTRVLEEIREATGYLVKLADFTVWRLDGFQGFTYLTEPGRLAFHKYVTVKKIPEALPPYMAYTRPPERHHDAPEYLRKFEEDREL